MTTLGAPCSNDRADMIMTTLGFRWWIVKFDRVLTIALWFCANLTCSPFISTSMYRGIEVAYFTRWWRSRRPAFTSMLKLQGSNGSIIHLAKVYFFNPESIPIWPSKVLYTGSPDSRQTQRSERGKSKWSDWCIDTDDIHTCMSYLGLHYYDLIPPN